MNHPTLRVVAFLAAALAAGCAHAPPSPKELSLPAADRRHCEITGHMIRDIYGDASSGGPVSIITHPSSGLLVSLMEIPDLSDADTRELDSSGAPFARWRHDCDWAALGLPKTTLVSAARGALVIDLPIYTTDNRWAAAQMYRRNTSRTCVFRRADTEWRVVRCSDDIIVIAAGAN